MCIVIHRCIIQAFSETQLKRIYHTKDVDVKMENVMHREMVSHDAANSNKTASDLMMHFITNEKTYSSFLVRYNDKNNFGDKN